jgi:transposase
MMGRLKRDQEHLFYSFRLDEVVPDDHLVRAIAAVLDLSWVHAELTSYYPKIGRPSIDPVLMIRMLIVGYVFAIRSERALCREVQVNLAYRWFCGLSIEDKVPDHSAFSRARNERFGDSIFFRSVFERVVGSCVAAGSSVVKALPSMRASSRPTPTSIARSPVRSGTRISIQSRRVARSRNIWLRSTIRPMAQQAASRRSSSHHPIPLPNGLARCAMQHSSPTPTIISST